jgi:hypothetical protein
MVKSLKVNGKMEPRIAMVFGNHPKEISVRKIGS